MSAEQVLPFPIPPKISSSSITDIDLTVNAIIDDRLDDTIITTETWWSSAKIATEIGGGGNPSNYIDFIESASSQPTPPNGQLRLYTKDDGKNYVC